MSRGTGRVVSAAGSWAGPPYETIQAEASYSSRLPAFGLDTFGRYSALQSEMDKQRLKPWPLS